MINPRYGNLQSLFADRVFRIPHYQRFYSWRTRQRDDLFSDLEKLAGRQGQDHFMATIVCYQTTETKAIGANQYQVYDIVDGQQRMTTLIILLKCIELAMPARSEDRNDLAKILVKRDGQLILLQTNNANERIFNRFIREGMPPEEQDMETYSDENLAWAIRECIQFVKKWQHGNGLDELMHLILHRLGFVVYDTVDSRVVYTVFEVLNSRGLAVEWLDKTKSVLMGRAFELADGSQSAAEAEIHTLQGIWSHIYREIAKEDVDGDEILRMTATLYYGTGTSKPLSAEDSLEKLRKDCATLDKPRRVSERLLDVARKLGSVYGNLFLGPVTEILHARMLAVAIKLAKGVSEPERKKLLEQWERVTFRIFGLCSKDARTKVGDYVRTAVKIVTEDLEMRTYNQIMAAMKSIGSEFPIDKALEEGLIGRDCYERSPDVCRYVLWLYEEHLTRQLGSGATVDEHDRNAIWKCRAADSIEHIFPQNPESEVGWQDKMRREGGENEPISEHVGRIGNLVLLPIILNQQARIHPFLKKKELYSKHNLRMIQEICAETDWTLDQIEAREAKIVAWGKLQWDDL